MLLLSRYVERYLLEKANFIKSSKRFGNVNRVITIVAKVIVNKTVAQSREKLFLSKKSISINAVKILILCGIKPFNFIKKTTFKKSYI